MYICSFYNTLISPSKHALIGEGSFQLAESLLIFAFSWDEKKTFCIVAVVCTSSVYECKYLYT